MIKNIRDNYRIYNLIIVYITKKSLVLNYGLSNITFESPNHVSPFKNRVIWWEMMKNIKKYKME
jgi:hypothetical protein